MMRIIVHHNSTPIKIYQFTTESVTIGRLATNTIPVNSMGVSRHHLKVERDSTTGKMFAEDMGSLNGSFINNQKISRMAFANGTEIVLGKYSLVVEFTEEEPLIDETVAPVIEVAPEPISQPITQTSMMAMDASVTSEHAASLVLDELRLMTENEIVVQSETMPEIVVESTGDELVLMENNEQAISFAEPMTSTTSIVPPATPVEETVNGGTFVFTSTAQQKKITGEEELDITTNAVLIDLNRQVIYKINKTKMTFGSGKNADIFVESGVFSSDNLATLTVDESGFLLTKGNGKLKVNEKKVPSYLLSHKDKIRLDNSEFSFMIKDNG